MKHFVNNTLRALLTAIGLSLAAVSAYLTAIFLYDYGQTNGYSMAYSTAGVLLDVAKTFFPIAALIAIRNGYRAIGVAAIALCAVMMFTSYTISVSALSNSAHSLSRTAIEQTYDYKNKTEAIRSLEVQIATKQDRITRLRSVRYHSDADAIQIEVDQLSTELRDLLLKRGQKPETSNSDFNLTAAKILSALIEITSSVTLVLVSAIGRPLNEHPVSNPQVVEPSPFKFDERPIAEVCDDILEQQEETPPTPEEIEPPANEPTPEEVPPILLHAQHLLAGGQARPSERSLSEAMDIKRSVAAQILTDLEDSGFLVRDGRVRVLAV